MTLDELRPFMLVQAGDELLKISAVYEHSVTAQVVGPIPDRTRVRLYHAHEVAGFVQPGDDVVAAYERAYRSLPRNEPNTEIPECHICGAPLGQSHDPVCPVDLAR